MDIIGYVFAGIALIALIVGLKKGFVSTLLGLLSAVGSIAVAIIFTPKVCEMEFVKNAIEDTPIVINGQEMFYLRTVIVFFVLFVVSLIVILAIKGLFKSILKRAKALKFIDRLLGGVFNVAIVWAVFGILFAISNIGTDWLLAIEEQITSSGLEIALVEPVGNALTTVHGSQILQTVFGAFNPIGELVAGLLL